MKCSITAPRLLAGCLLLSGCEGQTASIDLPHEPAVNAIAIYAVENDSHWRMLSTGAPIRVYTARDSISQIMEFLQQNNRGWYYPWNHEFHPILAVTFLDESGRRTLMLWLSADMVAAMASPITPKKPAIFWSLGEKEFARLKSLLEIEL